MKECKENMMELLRIQHALAAVGYYAYKVEKQLGVGEIVIRARNYNYGDDERLILRNAEELENT